MLEDEIAELFVELDGLSTIATAHEIGVKRGSSGRRELLQEHIVRKIVFQAVHFRPQSPSAQERGPVPCASVIYEEIGNAEWRFRDDPRQGCPGRDDGLIEHFKDR